MFVLGNLCQAIAIILDKVLWLYSMVVVASVLIQWVSPDPFNPLSSTVGRVATSSQG